MKWEACELCGGAQQMEIVGDPYAEVPESVWELLQMVTLLDRGVPALPEVGGWMDQPAAWCDALAYAMAERSRMHRAAERREIEKLRQ